MRQLGDFRSGRHRHFAALDGPDELQGRPCREPDGRATERSPTFRSSAALARVITNMPIGISAAVCPCVSVSSLAPTIDRWLSSKCLRRILALVTFSRHQTVGFTNLCFDLWPIRIAAECQRGKSMQKLLGALTAAALFIAAYDNASRFSCCRPQSCSGWRHRTRGGRMRPRRVARTLRALSLHAVLRQNARRRLCLPLQRLPTRLLAWPVGSLPQHAVPREASGRVVVAP
jgi:hypothetical protein